MSPGGTCRSLHSIFYAIWNWGRGTRPKSKYTVFPRVCRVKFDFSYRPAGWPLKVWLFELSCRAASSNWQAGLGRSIRRPDSAAYGGLVRSPDRSALAGLSIGLGRPAGEFEKPNFTRPPGRTIRKIKFYSADPREDRIFWFLAVSPSLSSI